MTQAQPGDPLTRAFVSSVESGRTVPSLPALHHLATRLEVPLSELFEGIEARASSPT
jgi:transcriptional regulator with XRE-family HTH domain